MKRKFTTLDLVHSSFFVVLIAVGGFIKLPFPLVPITLQFFFVNLAMLILNKNKASIAVGVYILLGLAGIPIFAGGGGISYLLHPTFGYLIGMFLGVFISGKLKEFLLANKIQNGEKNYKNYFKVFLSSSLLNMALVYAIGLPFMMIIVKVYLGVDVALTKLIMSGFLLTLPGDFIKIFLSCLVAIKIDKQIGKI